MKKILEVKQNGDFDFRFDTDFDPKKEAGKIPGIISGIAGAMVTSLWGGNELGVLAMIRALAIADLAASVNRKEMIRFLDEESRNLAEAMESARREMERRGAVIKTFPPGVKPQNTMS